MPLLLFIAFLAFVVICLVLKPCDAQTVSLTSITICIHQIANAQCSVCICELHAACANGQHRASFCRMQGHLTSYAFSACMMQAPRPRYSSL